MKVEIVTETTRILLLESKKRSHNFKYCIQNYRRYDQPGRHTGKTSLGRHTGKTSLGRHTGKTSLGRHTGKTSLGRHTGKTSLGRHTHGQQSATDLTETADKKTS
jgi:hypothetical protein